MGVTGVGGGAVMNAPPLLNDNPVLQKPVFAQKFTTPPATAADGSSTAASYVQTNSGDDPTASVDPQAFAAAQETLANLARSAAVGLGELMIKFEDLQESSTLAESLAALQAAKQDLLDEAKELDQSADKIETGAIVQLSLSVAAAAASFVTAGMAYKMAATPALKGLKADEIVNPEAPEVSEFGSGSQPGTKGADDDLGTGPGSTPTAQPASPNGTTPSTGPTPDDAPPGDPDNASTADPDDPDPGAALTKTLKEADDTAARNAKVQILTNLSQTLLQFFEAGANFGNSLEQAESQKDQAAGKVDDANAQDMQALVANLKAIMDKIASTLSAMVGVLQQLEDEKATELGNLAVKG